MKPEDFVKAIQPVNGIEINSVGIIRSICEKGVQVYFIGKNVEVVTRSDSIHIIDADRTGDRYTEKICNICHILKPTEQFTTTLHNRQSEPIRLPSCKVCRKEIDGKNMTAAERRKIDTKKPPDKTIFVCRICKKRTVVGITAKIVRDHDHVTGRGREWICHGCNTGLGSFKDDIAILEVAIEYLKRFKDN